jgi:hypothetical protein
VSAEAIATRRGERASSNPSVATARPMRERARSLVLVGAAMLLTVTLVGAASTWTAGLRPWGTLPPGTAALEAQIVAEQARSDALQAALDDLDAGTAELTGALDAVGAQLAERTQAAGALRADLAAARSRLAELERALAAASSRGRAASP